MHIWRISNYADLSGRGGLHKAGRWNRKGTPIVYCSDHPSTALLEVLVHFDRDELPENYQLIKIEINTNLVREAVDLPTKWQSSEDQSRAYWQRFVDTAEFPALIVPSIIMPHVFNILINPEHEKISEVKIIEKLKKPIDPRFLS